MSIDVAAWMLGLAVALLGAANGSFSELISQRLPARRSLWWPPSACDACGRRLRIWHNVPLVSFALLRGRCAACRVRIPWRTWAVEWVMAAVALALWARLGPTPLFALWMPLSALAMAIALCDLDHFWVPDVLVWPAAALALGGALLPGGHGFLGALVGALPALGLWGLGAAFARLTGREGLGFGDVKWAAALGLATGAAAAFGLLFWASVQAALWVLLAGVRARLWPVAPRPPVPPVPPPAAISDDADWVPPPGAVPFAPFLSLAAIEVTCRPDLFVGHGGALVDLIIRRSLPAWGG